MKIMLKEQNRQKKTFCGKKIKFTSLKIEIRTIKTYIHKRIIFL